MARPTEASVKIMKKIARYLIAHPRLILHYAPSKYSGELRMQTDSDHGGDVQTRASTSGWVARRGNHYIGGGTSTQQVIACSSGEAEYYAGLKGASEGLGIGAIAKELGMSLSLHLETDSSASYGTCKRRGHGKLKHMEIKYLWLQQAVYAERLSIQKIPRSENRSDLFTKACDIKDLEEHLKGLNMTRTNKPTEAKGMKVGVNLEAMSASSRFRLMAMLAVAGQQLADASAVETTAEQGKSEGG
eukprot:1734985-Amphidinium_carterae.1